MRTKTGLLSVWTDCSNQVTVENEFGEMVPLCPAYFYYGMYVMEMHPLYGTAVHGLVYELSEDWNAGFIYQEVASSMIDTELLHRAINGYNVSFITCGGHRPVFHKN